MAEPGPQAANPSERAPALGFAWLPPAMVGLVAEICYRSLSRLKSSSVQPSPGRRRSPLRCHKEGLLLGGGGDHYAPLTL